MSYLIAIDGRIVGDETAASVPVLDRGFLYGDSVYEVIRTYGGRPFALDEHLARLEWSAKAIEIVLPIPLAQLAREVRELVEQGGEPANRIVRVVLTRGAGVLGLDPDLADRPRRVLILADLPDVPEQLRREGVSVALVPAGRTVGGALPGGAKTGNYLTNLMALRRARTGGAFEAILVDTEGRLAEGTTSNLFLFSGGALRTPPLATGILDGITRRKVMALGDSAGIEVVEEDLRPLDLYAADEVFLTSTIKEILPVTAVDGVVVGDGRPGPVTTRLRYLYEGSTRAG